MAAPQPAERAVQSGREQKPRGARTPPSVRPFKVATARPHSMVEPSSSILFPYKQILVGRFA
eukprot:275453-Pyramimonas_sp.AAC.1